MWSLISTGVPGVQCSLMPPAPLVRIIVVAPVAAAVRTRVHDAAHAVALVVVGAGADDERALAARQQHRAQRADVALERGLGEAGDLGRRDRVRGLADQLGGAAPAAAEREGDVVALDAGDLGDLRGGVGGDGEGVGVRVVERVGIVHPTTLATRRMPRQAVLVCWLGARNDRM